MRKIFLMLLICLLIISCSSNEENTNEENAVEVSVPENLVGSWKFVGIYNYFDIDQTDNPHIEYYENGNVLTFNSNKTFNNNGDINYNGTYKIYADSVLTRFFNASESTNSFNQNVKIVTLNDSILDFTCTNEDNIGTCPCEAYRYVKVN